MDAGGRGKSGRLLFQYSGATVEYKNRTITINQNSYSEHHEYNEAKLLELEFSQNVMLQ